jgi:nicotinamidase-related amidase
VLVADVTTNFVGESTARERSDLGYEMVVARDCCTSLLDKMHEAALKHVPSSLGDRRPDAASRVGFRCWGDVD